MPPSVHRQVLHGATLIVIQDHARPLVQFCCTLRHGAGQDPEGQSGALYIALELSLRGTCTRSREHFYNELEEMGSSIHVSAGHETATVSGFSLTRHLPSTLDLWREAWLEPALADGEREDLIAETIDSLRASRDDDDTVADVFLRRALYRGHPFARSPWGTVPDLTALGATEVRSALARHLCRQELVLVFAGDITPDDAARLVEPWLLQLPAQAPQPLHNLEVPAPRPGLRITLVDKPDRTQVQMRLGRLTLAGRHPDSLPFWLAVLAFGGTFTSPFTHEVREVRGWSYHADASFDRWRQQPAPLYISSAPAASDALDCLELELSLLQQLEQGQLSDELLERARSYVLNRFPLQLTTAGDLITPALRRELLGMPPSELFSFPQELAQVSPEAARAAARKALESRALEVVLVATASELEKPLRARFPEAEVRVESYRDHL